MIPPAAVAPLTREPPDVEALRAEFGELTNDRLVKRREALRILSEKHGIPVNDLYRLLGS
jgi:hypothetical protein